MSESVAWGILGAGAIAKAFIRGLEDLTCGHIAAIGSRSAEKAKAFAQEQGVPNAACYGGYDALLADPQVQAVYIATPHPMHAEWAIKAAAAGKHVFCEKPAGMNHAQTQSMIQAAKDHGTFFMEAFKDRCHPQTQKVIELIKDGAIGQVRMARLSFGFNADEWGGVDPSSRLFDPQLGGGAVLDVGCYAVEFARLIAGTASGKPFLNPTTLHAAGHLGETGVDEWTAAILQFENDVVIQVATAVRAQLQNDCRIMGEKGTLTLPDPWLNGRDGAQPGKVILNASGEETVFDIDSQFSGFGYEAKIVCEAILAGKQQPDAPAMTWDDTLGQAQTLDRWRQAIGLTYPCD